MLVSFAVFCPYTASIVMVAFPWLASIMSQCASAPWPTQLGAFGVVGVCPTAAQSEVKLPGCGPGEPGSMAIVAFAVLPVPLLHSPGKDVVVPFCQVMLLNVDGGDVYH